MSCEHCRIGHIQSTLTPYIQWLDGQIMIIPNAPASSCDVCGYMEYDAIFIHKLNHLLAQFSKTTPSNGVVYRPVMAGAIPPLPSTRGSR